MPCSTRDTLPCDLCIMTLTAMGRFGLPSFPIIRRLHDNSRTSQFRIGISLLNFALVGLNKCIRKSTMAPAAGLMNDSHECNDMKMLEIDMHC